MAEETQREALAAETQRLPPYEIRTVPVTEAVGKLPDEAWAPSRFLEMVLRYPQAFYDALAEERMTGTFIGQLFVFSVMLFAFYGALMGLFGGWVQAAASFIKMPLLFLATLAICLPSLYIFNLVLGSQLKFLPMVALLLYAVCLTAALSVSLAPVAFFFMICGSDYRFMVLLHVAILAVSGLVGLVGMYRGLKALCEKAGGYGTGRVFRVWVFLYAIVGAQMSWLMRPFLGMPDLPFQIFRPVEGNFFTAVFRTLFTLLFD